MVFERLNIIVNFRLTFTASLLQLVVNF